jgi:hypothetical protein
VSPIVTALAAAMAATASARTIRFLNLRA